MASKKEIDKHLAIALSEIGPIKPRFSRRFKVWIFKHRAYPDVEYGGDSPEEVIRNYPLYLREFIKQRLNRNITEAVEEQTKGRGGRRKGAGRPRGSKKEPTKRISLPMDIAKWFDRPEAIPQFRHLLARVRY